MGPRYGYSLIDLEKRCIYDECYKKSFTLKLRNVLVTKQSSRATTEYLRGVVILIVMVGHYLLTYHNDFYNQYFFEYASMVLAVFFVLSGYGIFFSLERRFSGKDSLKSVLAQFYFDRASRIYFTYWLALIVYNLLPDSSMLRSLNSFSISAYLGGPSMFWFVTSILECYLLAPLLFLILKKLRPAVFAILLALALVVLLGVSRFFLSTGIADSGLLQALSYRFLLLGNIVLFSLGMMIPYLVSKYQDKVNKTAFILISLAGFLLAVHFGRSGLRFHPLFVLSSFAFCLSMISRSPKLPLGKFVNVIGRNSFSLYLFHRAFFVVLAGAGIISTGSKAGIFYMLLLSPALIGFCVILERGVNKATVAIKRGIFPLVQPGNLAVTQSGHGPATADADLTQ